MTNICVATADHDLHTIGAASLIGMADNSHIARIIWFQYVVLCHVNSLLLCLCNSSPSATNRVPVCAWFAIGADPGSAFGVVTHHNVGATDSLHQFAV